MERKSKETLTAAHVGDRVICHGCPVHEGQTGRVLETTERTWRVLVDGGGVCYPLHVERVEPE